MPAHYRAILAREASEDLQAIFEYIAGDSPSNAASMIERILRSLELLEVFPHRTIVDPPYAVQGKPLRSLPVGSYVVYFSVNDETRIVQVLRVIHGARRRPNRFG
jgi:toxin ParE1/3/4